MLIGKGLRTFPFLKKKTTIEVSAMTDVKMSVAQVWEDEKKIEVGKYFSCRGK
jgi:hypothetical protein